jgi:hypothetical protein
LKEYQFILQYGFKTETIIINPIGWDGIGIQFYRHEFYYSLLRTTTLPLKFIRKPGGGADFLYSAYQNEGIAAKVFVICNQLNRRTNGYELWYRGIVDFKTYLLERDSLSVTIMDGQKEQLFISRDEITINLLNEVSLDGIALASITPKSISLPPIDVILNSAGAGKVSNNGDIVFGSTGYQQMYVRPGLTPLDHTLNGSYVDQMTTAYSYIENPVYIRNEIADRLTIGPSSNPSQQIWLNSTTEVINLTSHFWGHAYFYVCGANFDGGVSVWYGCPVTVSYVIEYRDKDGNLLGNQILFNKKAYQPTRGWIFEDFGEPYGDPPGSVSTPFIREILDGSENAYGVKAEFDFDVTLQYDVPPEGYVNFMVTFEGETGSDHTSIVFQSENINFTFKEDSYGRAETTAPALFPHEAFSRLIQAMTSETDTSKLLNSTEFGRTDSQFNSYSEDGPSSKYAIMSAFTIRNYPTAPINVTMRDLFKSFDSVRNLGLGYDRVNDRFYIEKKEKFFDKNYFMFDLGEVAEFKVTALLMDYFSKITAGYENTGLYEQYQGAFEFNTQRQYATTQPVNTEENIRSKYNFDSIGIELCRRHQYSDSSSLDTRFDQYNYIVDTDGTRPILNSSITGFDGIDKYYNTALTPRQNVLRWGNILKACLYKNEDGISFQSASKLISMVYDSIDELSNISNGELPEGLFIPELFSFKSYVNRRILGILNVNPHGYATGTFRGIRFVGFLNKLETASNYNKIGTYELIGSSIVMPPLTADDTYITADSTIVTSDQTIKK